MLAFNRFSLLTIEGRGGALCSHGAGPARRKPRAPNGPFESVACRVAQRLPCRLRQRLYDDRGNLRAVDFRLLRPQDCAGGKVPYETSMRLTGGCGAEVLSVDVGDEQPPVGRGAGGLAEHGAVFFRPEFTPEQHTTSRGAGRRSSTVLQGGRRPSRDRRGAQGARAEDQHRRRLAHRPFLRRGRRWADLLARELPEEGGDTLFANMYLAPRRFARPAAHARRHERRARLGARFRQGWCQRPEPGRQEPLRQPGEGRRRRDPPGCDPASAERPQVALCQPGLHLALRGLVGRGQQAAARPSLPPCLTAGIHLPLPLARGIDRLLGQPRHLALCRQRLHGEPVTHRITRVRRTEVGFWRASGSLI